MFMDDVMTSVTGSVEVVIGGDGDDDGGGGG